MAAQQHNQPPEEKRSAGSAQAPGRKRIGKVESAVAPALPHQPSVGAVDITGIVREGIRIDPDITERHPGYEESGDSEIIPPERLAGGGTQTPAHGK